MNKLKLTLLSAAIALTPLTSQAQSGISLFLDSQTTTWLKDMGTPLLKAANIHEDDVRFHLVNNKEINAFVTHSRDLFMHTGLILKAENASEVQGVMAHEIGHIQGRHTSKYLKNRSKFAIPTILGSVLGVGAAALGAPQAATALMIGGQAAGQSSQLSFTRTQEREADNYGVDLLHSTNHSATGLYSFFEKLRSHQLLYSRTPPAYLLTHPLPSERMANVKNRLREESIKELTASPDAVQFELIKAKLFAFTSKHATTLRKYRDINNPAHLYARSIVYALQGKTQESLKLLDKTIIAHPNLPHLYEIKGQIELDTGDLNRAADSLAHALLLRDDLPIVRMQYGETLSNANQQEKAIEQLIRVTQELPTWPRAYHSLGIAYGRAGKLALSHLSLFEEARLKRNIKEARTHIAMAEKYIENSTPQAKKRLDRYKKQLKEAQKN